MDKLENKHLEHIAAMQAITDYSWHSWNSPIGLGLGLIGIVLFLNGFVLLWICVISDFGKILFSHEINENE